MRQLRLSFRVKCNRLNQHNSSLFALSTAILCPEIVPWKPLLEVSSDFYSHLEQNPVSPRRIPPNIFLADFSDCANAHPFGDCVVLHGFFCDQRGYAWDDSGRRLGLSAP